MLVCCVAKQNFLNTGLVFGRSRRRRKVKIKITGRLVGKNATALVLTVTDDVLQISSEFCYRQTKIAKLLL